MKQQFAVPNSLEPGGFTVHRQPNLDGLRHHPKVTLEISQDVFQRPGGQPDISQGVAIPDIDLCRQSGAIAAVARLVGGIVQERRVLDEGNPAFLVGQGKSTEAGFAQPTGRIDAAFFEILDDEPCPNIADCLGRLASHSQLQAVPFAFASGSPCDDRQSITSFWQPAESRKAAVCICLGQLASMKPSRGRPESPRLHEETTMRRVSYRVLPLVLCVGLSACAGRTAHPVSIAQSYDSGPVLRPDPGRNHGQ